MNEPRIQLTEVRVSPFGYRIIEDATLPHGVIRLVDLATGKGVEYSDQTKQVRVIP